MEILHNQVFHAQISSPFPPLPNSVSDSQSDNQSPEPAILPPTTFAPTIPPPQVPVRLELYEPLLDKLEAGFRVNGPHPILGDVSQNQKAQEDAFAVLEKHVRDRTPFILAACKRLQAVVGIQNDLPFTVGLENRVSNQPAFNVGYDIRNETTGQSAKRSKIVRNHRHLPADNACVQATRSLTTGLGISSLDIDQSMLRYVDPSTGAGLREYIIMRRMIMGSRKRDCRSISFHDFTPDMREGTSKNQLLAHLGVERGFAGAERIECEEIDLPDPTGRLYPWISIFIQQPLVKYSPAAPPSISPSPPDFPHPAPTSWLMFVAPLSHVSTYPPQHDTAIPSSLLESTVSTRGIPTKKVALRQDFDFSFQGVPVWEFSDKSYLPTTHTYSVFTDPKLPAIVPSKNFLTLSLPPLSHLADQSFSVYPAGTDLLAKTASHFYRSGGTPEEFAELVDQGLDKCVFQGEWWQEFYIRMAEERNRWRRVRESMGRGKCRVVVRWQEVNRGVGMGRNGIRVGTGVGTQLGVLKENERARARGNGAFAMPDDRCGSDTKMGFGDENTSRWSHK
ncbi:hypothetical protein CJF32_00002789 [Rutstroemia sp. NJR-2017a WRK4]|nr:hypothetical protein CJF32_00002789 [Rutstroemia sp. NJR-2017a WRK4]